MNEPINNCVGVRVRLSIERWVATRWQPRTGNERQALGGRIADMEEELLAYCLEYRGLKGRWPHQENLDAAAMVVGRMGDRKPGYPRFMNADVFRRYRPFIEAEEGATFPD